MTVNKHFFSPLKLIWVLTTADKLTFTNEKASFFANFEYIFSFLS